MKIVFLPNYYPKGAWALIQGNEIVYLISPENLEKDFGFCTTFPKKVT